MNASSAAASRYDIQGLAQSMRHCNALDAVPLSLSEGQWTTLANYLQPVSLSQGQVLIEQGVKDLVGKLIGLRLLLQSRFQQLIHVF